MAGSLAMDAGTDAAGAEDVLGIADERGSRGAAALAAGLRRSVVGHPSAFGLERTPEFARGGLQEGQAQGEATQGPSSFNVDNVVPPNGASQEPIPVATLAWQSQARRQTSPPSPPYR